MGDYSTLSLLSLHRGRSVGAICRVINSYCNLIEMWWVCVCVGGVKPPSLLSLRSQSQSTTTQPIQNSTSGVAWRQVGGKPYICQAPQCAKGHSAN